MGPQVGMERGRTLVTWAIQISKTPATHERSPRSCACGWCCGGLFGERAEKSDEAVADSLDRTESAGQGVPMDLAPETSFPRSAGVLVHPSSLPGGYGIGDLGQTTSRLLDFMAQYGLYHWQILPLAPPGPGESPYSASSSFAGNPWLLDLDILQKANLLETADLEHGGFPLDQINFSAMKAFKKPRLEKAASTLLANPSHPWFSGYQHFLSTNAWIEDDALFHALRAHYEVPWWQWPDDVRRKEKNACARARETLKETIDQYAVLQFFFDMQWQMVKGQAFDLGISVFGDIPIYVARDSVDVWAFPEQFLLDKNGAPRIVAGAPPDPFAERGQMWGNPIYNWSRMKEDGHRYWIRRLKRALSLTPTLRIDHFRGLSAYWGIPADAPDARAGQFYEGPGMAFFHDIKKALGPVNLVAEDLGVLDDDVYRLLEDSGLPGMRVLQFAFGSESINLHLPHQHRENMVVYTGTHDNPTTRHWWESTSESVRDHVRRYFSTDGSDVVWDLIRAAMQSPAHTAIIPLQDFLVLGPDARMNTPGEAEGNWGWRVRSEAFSPSVGERIAGLTDVYNRDILKRAREESMTAVKPKKPAPWRETF